MTAPGNSVILLVLLALFVACTAYAAGRMHQRYRTLHERDEAYRDGYDTATRSVFSLAARVIGPRRERAAIRGSAKVRVAAEEPPPPDAGNVVDGSVVAAAVPRPEPVSIGFPAPAPFEPPAVAESEAGSFWSPGLGVAYPPRRFAVSPPPSADDVDGAFAADPPIDSSGLPDSGSPDAGSWVQAEVQAEPELPAGTELQAGTEFQAERLRASCTASPGRHTVPDELVRAATYRLAPDRVARAKVHHKAPGDLPDDETTRLPDSTPPPIAQPRTSVPKPRSS